MQLFIPHQGLGSLFSVHQPSLELISRHANQNRSVTVLIIGQQQAYTVLSFSWLVPKTFMRMFSTTTLNTS